MSDFRLSLLAEDDLLEIGLYTQRRWGAGQANRYLDGLENCCQMLAANPDLGRGCDDVRVGLRRMEHASHVVFFRREQRGILVARILHKSMHPGKHAMEDE